MPPGTSLLERRVSSGDQVSRVAGAGNEARQVAGLHRLLAAAYSGGVELLRVNAFLMRLDLRRRHRQSNS
jgi:hypothetical protein